MELKFIRRNLKIYFQDKQGVFFSFLGVLISLLIYIFFLRNTLIKSFNTYQNIGKIIDLWMMGGLISISSITTTLAGFNQKLADYNSKAIYDFIINSSFSVKKLNLLYIIAVVIEASLSVTLFTIIIFGYLLLEYGKIINLEKFILIELSSFSLIIFSALMFNFITNYVKTTNSFSSLSAIVGTLTGFLAGTYIPYGSLPNFMQKILNYWLGYQNAAIDRYIMLKGIYFPNEIKKNLFHQLGILEYFKIAIICFILSICTVIILNLFKVNKAK